MAGFFLTSIVASRNVSKISKGSEGKEGRLDGRLNIGWDRIFFSRPQDVVNAPHLSLLVFDGYGWQRFKSLIRRCASQIRR